VCEGKKWFIYFLEKFNNQYLYESFVFHIVDNNRDICISIVTIRISISIRWIINLLFTFEPYLSDRCVDCQKIELDRRQYVNIIAEWIRMYTYIYMCVCVDSKMSMKSIHTSTCILIRRESFLVHEHEEIIESYLTSLKSIRSSTFHAYRWDMFDLRCAMLLIVTSSCQGRSLFSEWERETKKERKKKRIDHSAIYIHRLSRCLYVRLVNRTIIRLI
jgi:hypothetical protein